MNKLKLSYEGQINHLKSKGILFNKVSETKALEYLKLNNNFFKLKSYRKNWSIPHTDDQGTPDRFRNRDQRQHAKTGDSLYCG